MFKKPSIPLNKFEVINEQRFSEYYQASTLKTLRKSKAGHVCKILTQDGKEVCIKFVSDELTNKASLNSDFLEQLNQYKSCIHTNAIYTLNGSYYMDFKQLLEVEYANQGSLYDFLKTGPKVKYVYGLLIEALDQLGELHRDGICHNDIKPSNILVTLKNRRYAIRWNDFNLVSPNEKAIVCTPEYASPEVIQESHYSSSSDIWAFGVMLHELFARKLPFGSRMQGDNYETIFDRVKNQELGNLSGIPAPFDAIIKACLIKDVSQRPSSVKKLWKKVGLNPKPYLKGLAV